GRLEERALATLRWVLFVGEAFPTKHPRTLMERLPHPCYANLYGPIETIVYTYDEVEPLSLEQTVPIPLGKACANTDLIPINAEGKRVVTTNEEGLLYARRSTVMQSYYSRPEAGLVFDAWGLIWQMRSCSPKTGWRPQLNSKTSSLAQAWQL